MTDQYVSRILYDPGDPDISQALLRCRDLVAWVSQSLYPGADPTGYTPDPGLTFTEPPVTLLWWLCSLQVTLDSLYCQTTASPSDPLATALSAYLAQHPEQAPELQQVLVEANARNFIQWDQVRIFIASPLPVSAAASEPVEPER